MESGFNSISPINTGKAFLQKFLHLVFLFIFAGLKNLVYGYINI